MSQLEIDAEEIQQLRTRLDQLKSHLARSTAKQVQARPIAQCARDLVEYYFDTARPALVEKRLDDESLGGLDTLLQELLVLSQKAPLRKSYEQKIRSIAQELNGVEVSLVTKVGVPDRNAEKLDGKEDRIAKTLADLVPTAGASYEQACMDLRDASRKSFRGAAGELREALRETLEYLAPDRDVMAQSNFKLESDREKPTMKQKVRYILASRGRSKSISETPEAAVQVVEERVGALARSVYNRSSVSAHVGTTKEEVQQIKAYVDVVFSDLLEIA